MGHRLTNEALQPGGLAMILLLLIALIVNFLKVEVIGGTPQRKGALESTSASADLSPHGGKQHDAPHATDPGGPAGRGPPARQRVLRRSARRPPSATYDPPGLVFFDLAGTRLMLEVNAPAAMLYLAVDDVDATIERLRGDGVTIEHEPHVIFSHDDDTLGPAGTDEWQAFVRDSEGNLLGLVEHRVPQAGATGPA